MEVEASYASLGGASRDDDRYPLARTTFVITLKFPCRNLNTKELDVRACGMNGVCSEKN